MSISLKQLSRADKNREFNGAIFALFSSYGLEYIAVPRGGNMRFLRNNGLSLTLIALFIACLIGFIFTGYAETNEEKQQKGEPTVTLGDYLSSGDFAEPLFVNWESEFLQQFAYVVLTVFLFQK